jgi:hypothetical protein
MQEQMAKKIAEGDAERRDLRRQLDEREAEAARARQERDAVKRTSDAQA